MTHLITRSRFASAASAVALLSLVSTAAPGVLRHGPQAAVLTAHQTSRPAQTGASDIADLGTNGWRVVSSAVATQSGAAISTPGFNDGSWLPVSNDDAGAPGTEIEALAANGKCPGDTSLQPVNLSTASPHSVYFGENMKLCYGYERRVEKDTDPRFDVPWWWRTDFNQDLGSRHSATLIVNGVIGAADVWLNGHELATSATVTGAYTRFTFNITGLARQGTNSLAIEILPNDPNKMFTLDDVDWNQIPPDNNTGIEFPVQLEVDGALSDGDAYVTQDDAANLSRAALTVSTEITNHTVTSQAATVTATITPPGGGTPIALSRDVFVPASTTKTITFTPARYPMLTVQHPKVWWPYQLGGQPLYKLATSVMQNGKVLNSTGETFGIRTVTSYLTGKSAAEPAGARAFKVNGVPIVIRGGGWSPNIFLHYSSADTSEQAALMKNLGVNAIRLEGHIMPSQWLRQMDRAGILVNAGYQCCDAWQLQDSGLTSTEDYHLLALSALTIGENLRNDPSVFSFQWSDDNPLGRQEAVTVKAFGQAGFDDPVIASAEYKKVSPLGWSGEKEGPYNWVPPAYWYDTTHHATHDNSQTNAGGSWGYDSEQSAGDTVPTLDSLKRFMTPGELAKLWQDPLANQYHLNYEPSCNHSYSFGTLCLFDQALTARYGKAASLAQYVELAQAQDYEDTQSQFEAFIDHSGSKPLPSTGTIYWQMNKGFPSLLWNLYNTDGDQAGSYFGAQEANRKLHALYARDNGTVTLDNLSNHTHSGLSVEAKVYNLAGTLLDDRTAKNITLASQQVRTNVLTPKVPTATTPPQAAKTYFVEVLLSQGGKLADRNVYWLSTQKDVVNWDATIGNPSATLSRYANLQALQTLPKGAVSVTASTASRPGPDGANLATTVTIKNTSAAHTVAFLLRADVRRGTASGGLQAGDNELRSSIWTGDDITLWPGESQTLTVSYDSVDLDGATPVITVSGWNVPQMNIAAPVPAS
ncbi:MAG TPA: beta galactosidase jelly roll domain-containing protein [Streptosporangiaceae bacterium]